MNKDEMLRLARECGIPEQDIENLVEHHCAALERFAEAMIAVGAEDAIPDGYTLAKRYFCTKCGGSFTEQIHKGCDYMALDIRALPITTNTEGEQG